MESGAVEAVAAVSALAVAMTAALNMMRDRRNREWDARDRAAKAAQVKADLDAQTVQLAQHSAARHDQLVNLLLTLLPEQFPIVAGARLPEPIIPPVAPAPAPTPKEEQEEP